MLCCVARMIFQLLSTRITVLRALGLVCVECCWFEKSLMAIGRVVGCALWPRHTLLVVRRRDVHHNLLTCPDTFIRLMLDKWLVWVDKAYE